MQSTGHTSTQAVSLVPMHGSAITYVMAGCCSAGFGRASPAGLESAAILWRGGPFATPRERAGGRPKADTKWTLPARDLRRLICPGVGPVPGPARMTLPLFLLDELQSIAVPGAEAGRQLFLLPSAWIVVLLAYLVGAIPFGLLIAKRVAGIDLRTFGSGNIGTSNAVRAMGRRWGFVVFSLDFLKGFLPVLACHGLVGDHAETVPLLQVLTGT